MITEFRAVVDDVREQRRVQGRAVWQMALSRTAFRPGDQGLLTAVARSGTELKVPVLQVEEDGEGRLWHIVEKPLAAGTEISGVVRRV